MMEHPLMKHTYEISSKVQMTSHNLEIRTYKRAMLRDSVVGFLELLGEDLPGIVLHCI